MTLYHKCAYSFLVFFLFFFVACKVQENQIVNIDKKTIFLGDSVLVSWDVKDALSVSVTGVGEGLSPKGRVCIKPDSSFTVQVKPVYKVANEKQVPRALQRISVLEPVLYFNGPTNGNDEQQLTFEWEAKNVKTLRFADSAKQQLPYEGSIHLRLDTSRTISLIAENEFGKKVERHINVNILQMESFTAPQEIFLGDKAELNWDLKNTSYVTLDGDSVHYPASGSLSFMPKLTTTYYFRIHKKYGFVVPKPVTVRVLPPQILSFKGPQLAEPGVGFTLSWDVSGAKQIEIEGVQSNLPAKGSLRTETTNAKTYTLIAQNGDLKSEKKLNVETFERRFVKDTVSLKQLQKNQRFDMEIFSVDRSNYPNEIKLFVLVVDTLGNFVSGLAPPTGSSEVAKKYFMKLIENVEGKDYAIDNFKVEQSQQNLLLPRDLSMVLDYSGSMYGAAIDSLENSASYFLKNKESQDRVSLTKFDNKIVTELKLTKDKNKIDSVRFDGLARFGGNTALYAAASEGIQTLKDSKNKKALFLFTDGEENASMIYGVGWATTADQLVKYARKESTPIYVIGFGTGTNDMILSKIAMLTDGKFYKIRRTKDIKQVFKEMPLLLRNCYTITYKPRSTDGEREIELVYNNNDRKTMRTKRSVQVGDNFDISNLDLPQDAYWTKLVKGFKPISKPQAVAFFDFDRFVLEERYKPDLKRYADYLKQHPKQTAVVLGHSDMKGSNSYCDKISEHRAEIIKRYLVDQGVDPGHVVVKPLGKRYPLWKVEENDHKARENRRIEVLLCE